MAASSSRTYHGTDTGGLGGFVSIFPGGLAICAIAFLIAPFRWGTSPALAVPVALIFFAAAYGLWRLSRRLRQASLTVGPGGVRIVNAGRRRDLGWDQVLRFRAGTTPAASAFRGDVSIVVADLADGTTVAIDALKVDHGRLAADRDRARVEELCLQVESYRPRAPRSAPA
jgi:hypothetical protein